jgi:hypothetical protein
MPENNKETIYDARKYQGIKNYNPYSDVKPFYTDSKNTSQYDVGYTVPTEGGNPYEALMENRAQNQPGLDQLANGLAKGTGLAVTTFADTFAGTLGGILNMASNGLLAAQGKEDFAPLNSFINNPISNGLQDANDKMEEIFANYYTKDEESQSFLESLGTANFWGDKLLKNMGFAAGAMAAGYVGGAAFSGLSGVDKLRKETKILTDVANGITKGNAKTAEQALSLLAESPELLSSNAQTLVAELSANARQIRNLNRINQIQSSVLASTGEARLEALGNGRQFRDKLLQGINAEYLDETGKVKVGKEAEYQDKLSKLDDTVEGYQNSEFLWNTALLTASNFAGYRDIFAKSYELNKRNLGSLIEETVTDEGKRVYSLTKQPWYKIVGKSLQNAGREGLEELSQGVVQKASDDYYKAKFDTGEQGFSSMLKSAANGINQSMNKEGFENFFLGALTGIIMPGASIRTNYRDARKEEAENQTIVSNLNTAMDEYFAEYKSNPDKIGNIFQDMIMRSANLDKAQRQAILNDDKYNYEALKDEKFYNLASAYIKAGKHEALLDMIAEETHMPVSELRNKYAVTDATKLDENGQPTKTDYFKNWSDEEVKNFIKEKSDKAKDATKAIRNIHEDLETKFGKQFVELADSEGKRTQIEVKDLLARHIYLGKELDNRIEKLFAKTIPKTLDLFEGYFDRKRNELDTGDAMAIMNDLVSPKSLLELAKTPDRFKTFMNMLNNAADESEDSNLKQDALDLISLLQERFTHNSQWLRLTKNNFSETVDAIQKADAEQAEIEAKLEANDGKTPEEVDLETRTNTIKSMAATAGYTENIGKGTFVELPGKDGPQLFVIKTDPTNPKKAFFHDPINGGYFKRTADAKSGKYKKGDKVNASTDLLYSIKDKIKFIPEAEALERVKQDRVTKANSLKLAATQVILKEVTDTLEKSNKRLQSLNNEREAGLKLIEEATNSLVNATTDKVAELKELQKWLEESLKVTNKEIDELNKVIQSLEVELSTLKELHDNIKEYADSKTNFSFEKITNDLESSLNNSSELKEVFLQVKIDLENKIKSIQQYLKFDSLYKELSKKNFKLNKLFQTKWKGLPADFNIEDDVKDFDKLSPASKLRINSVLRVLKYKGYTMFGKPLDSPLDEEGKAAIDLMADELLADLKEVEESNANYKDTLVQRDILKKELIEHQKMYSDLLKRLSNMNPDSMLNAEATKLISDKLKVLEKLKGDIALEYAKQKMRDARPFVLDSESDFQYRQDEENTTTGLKEIQKKRDNNFLSTVLFRTTGKHIQSDRVVDAEGKEKEVDRLDADKNAQETTVVAQKRWFNFIEEHLADFNTGEFDDNYGLKVYQISLDSLANTPDDINQEAAQMIVESLTDSLGEAPTIDTLSAAYESSGKDFIVVVTDREGNPLKVNDEGIEDKNGKIVFTTLPKVNLATKNLNDNQAKWIYDLNHTKETDLDITPEMLKLKHKAYIEEQYNKFTDTLLERTTSGKPTYLKVKGLSPGVLIQTNILDDKGHKIKTNASEIVAKKGGGNLKVIRDEDAKFLGKNTKGLPYLEIPSTGEKILLRRKTLSKGDIDIVLALISTASGQSSLKGLPPLKQPFGTIPIFPSNGKVGMIESYIYWGAKKGSVNKNNIAINMKKGTVEFGDKGQSVKLEDVTNNSKNAELRLFLAGKMYNVNRAMLDRVDPMWLPKLNSKGIIEMDNRTPIMYKDMLLNGRLYTYNVANNKNFTKKTVTTANKNVIFATNQNLTMPIILDELPKKPEINYSDDDNFQDDIIGQDVRDEDTNTVIEYPAEKTISVQEALARYEESVKETVSSQSTNTKDDVERRKQEAESKITPIDIDVVDKSGNKTGEVRIKEYATIYGEKRLAAKTEEELKKLIQVEYNAELAALKVKPTVATKPITRLLVQLENQITDFEKDAQILFADPTIEKYETVVGNYEFDLSAELDDATRKDIESKLRDVKKSFKINKLEPQVEKPMSAVQAALLKAMNSAQSEVITKDEVDETTAETVKEECATGTASTVEPTITKTTITKPSASNRRVNKK